MTRPDAGMLVVGASHGSFELRFDAETEGMRFEPTHRGLVTLASTLEILGSNDVYALSSLARPEVSGLPAGYDARGFVEAAFTLSRLGLASSPGGNA